MDNLDEFLKGNDEVVAETPEAVEAPTEVVAEADEAPQATERPRGPDGKFIPKGETAETPAVESPSTPEPALDHAALIGERRRRQEAEAELVELRKQFQPAPQVQPQQPANAPDMFEDPEGYTRYIASQAAEVARREAYETFQYQRIEGSARQFAPSVPDYAEKVQVFQQMVQLNPALLQELYRSGNPAEYAYNTAKTQLEISQFGGIEGLIKARVEEALKAQAPPAANATPPVPDTLADAQSSRGSSEGFSPPSLDQILGRA